MIDINALIADFAGLPSPVQVALGYSIKPMLGDLKAIPAFLGKRLTRNVEASTIAHIEAAKELGRLTAAEAMNDTEYAAAAREAYLPSEVRRVKNRAAVAAAAIQSAAHDTIEGSENADAQVPDDDWMMAFMRHAEDASSEQLQKLFGKLLAGQIKRPGAFSRSTLRTVADLDQALASDFVWFWHQCVSDGAPTSIVPGPGSEWAKVTALRDAGLVSPVDSGTYQPQADSNTNIAMPWSLGFHDTYLAIWVIGSRNFVNMYSLTETGRQLSRIIDHPKKAENLRSLARRFSEESLSSKILLVDKGKTELIWAAGMQGIA